MDKPLSPYEAREEIAAIVKKAKPSDDALAKVFDPPVGTCVSPSEAEQAPIRRLVDDTLQLQDSIDGLTFGCQTKAGLLVHAWVSKEDGILYNENYLLLLRPDKKASEGFVVVSHRSDYRIVGNYDFDGDGRAETLVERAPPKEASKKPSRPLGATFFDSEEWELHQESGVKRYGTRLPRSWDSVVIGLGGRAVLLHESEDISIDSFYDGAYEWGPSDVRVVHFDGPTPVERSESAQRLASSTESVRRRAAAADMLAEIVDSNVLDLPDLPPAELSAWLDNRLQIVGAPENRRAPLIKALLQRDNEPAKPRDAGEAARKGMLELVKQTLREGEAAVSAELRRSATGGANPRPCQEPSESEKASVRAAIEGEVKALLATRFTALTRDSLSISFGCVVRGEALFSVEYSEASQGRWSISEIWSLAGSERKRIHYERTHYSSEWDHVYSVSLEGYGDFDGDGELDPLLCGSNHEVGEIGSSEICVARFSSREVVMVNGRASPRWIVNLGKRDGVLTLKDYESGLSEEPRAEVLALPWTRSSLEIATVGAKPSSAAIASMITRTEKNRARLRAALEVKRAIEDHEEGPELVKILHENLPRMGLAGAEVDRWVNELTATPR